MKEILVSQERLKKFHDLTQAQLNKKANLVDGKIPASELPSYVDDVLEYESKTSFPTTGESGKIYIAKNDNKTYRWSGTSYVEISASLALGETESTAYAGNKGKANADAITALQTKVQNIEAGQVTVDAQLSATSVNPVQNKVIKTELDKKATVDALSTLEGKVTANTNNIANKADNSAVTALGGRVSTVEETLEGKADAYDIITEATIESWFN